MTTVKFYPTGGKAVSPPSTDAIYFDQNNGGTLANKFDGSPSLPLNNEADVLTQLTAKKLSRIVITSSAGFGTSNFTLPQDIIGISFWGVDAENCVVTFNGFNATGCGFHELYLQGTNGATGYSTAYNCVVGGGFVDTNGWDYYDCIVQGMNYPTSNPYFYNCTFYSSAFIDTNTGSMVVISGTGSVQIGVTVSVFGDIQVQNATGIEVQYSLGKVPYQNSGFFNAFGITGTSGEVGVDLFSVNTTTIQVRTIHLLLIDISGFTAGSTVTVRIYHAIAGNERKIYNQDFLAGTDPNGIPVISGAMVISEPLRVEIQSNNALDTNAYVGWEYILE